MTKVFHPNISKTGEICVNTLKKDWKKDLGLKHVLLVRHLCATARSPAHHARVTQTIKCLLIVPNAESALNDEAGKLILENYDEYASMARLMTSLHAASKGEFGTDTAAPTATDAAATVAAEKAAVAKKSALVTDAKKRNLRRL